MPPYASDAIKDHPLRCEACGDVVGVYEPLVHVLEGIARQTSRGAEPAICRSEGDCYHLACFHGELAG